MKVLCFGSLNIDLVFNVDEFVKPKETIHSNKLTYFAGGKGLNQAIALKKAKVDVLIAGSIGKDGKLLLDTCKNNFIDFSYVKSIEGSSGMAIIQVDKSGENCIILHEGANTRNTIHFIDEVLSDFGEGDYLVLQNEINNLDYLLGKAYTKKMKIFLNPSPISSKIYQSHLEYCDYLIVNEVEGQALSGKSDFIEIVAELSSKYKNQIILTVGNEGVYYNQENNIYHVRAIKVNAVDTTGAGDAFAGYLIGEISRGTPIREAIEVAVNAAGIAVTKTGASDAIPELHDVITFMTQKN